MTTPTHLALSEDTSDIPMPTEQNIRDYLTTCVDTPLVGLFSLMSLYEGKASAVASFLGTSTSNILGAVAYIRYTARDWQESNILVKSDLTAGTAFDVPLEWEETPDHLAVLDELYSNTGMPVTHISAILGIDLSQAAVSAYIKRVVGTKRKQGARYKTDAEQRKKIVALSGMLDQLSLVLSLIQTNMQDTQETAEEIVVNPEDSGHLVWAGGPPPATLDQGESAGDTTSARGFFGSLWELIKGRRF